MSGLMECGFEYYPPSPDSKKYGKPEREFSKEDVNAGFVSTPLNNENRSVERRNWRKMDEDEDYD